MERTLAPLLAHLDAADPGGVVGAYVYGSAARSGLKPDSDLDVLLITRRAMSREERAQLVQVLLGISGWSGHADQFPEVAHRRPLEVTALVVEDVSAFATRPGRSWPQVDFQFGEWLRAELLAGDLPGPSEDADAVVLLATALQEHRLLRGAALEQLVAPIPASLLRRAAASQVGGVLAGFEGDERNTLLTLARILVTVETGKIVSKDEAARAVAGRREGREREVLELARAGYLGELSDEWAGREESARVAADALAQTIRHREGDAGLTS